MREELLNTAFGNLLSSYCQCFESLKTDEIEQVLRELAKKWGGCVSCRYSILHPDANKRGGNIWIQRACQLKLVEGECRLHNPFPD